MVNAKELDKKFSIIEKRIKAITTENRALQDRIRELEQELAEARKDARTGSHLSGVTGLVRERIEKVLQSLESLGTGRSEE